MFNGNVGGPINKKTSFYVDGQRRDIEDDAIVNATVLNSNFNADFPGRGRSPLPKRKRISAPALTPNLATTIR